MLRYLAGRVLHGLIVVAAISLAVFLALHLAPGDPAAMMAPNLGGTAADNQILDNIREQMGLNRPLYVQYFSFVGDILTGSFGISLQAHIPVGRLIAQRLPATLELATYSMLFAILVALPMGVISAQRNGSVVDYGLRLTALVGVSAPSFWIGLMLIVLFSVKWQIFPAGGRSDFLSYVLPVFTLGIQQVAMISRLLRSQLLEVLGLDYIRTARAKGTTERRVVYGHALQNTLIPVVTLVGLQLGTLLGGAVITESVFSWPGVGRLLLDSVLNRDYPVVQAAVIVFSMLFVVLNIFVDLSYAYLNPRIRFS